jgi:hypothetical protein
LGCYGRPCLPGTGLGAQEASQVRAIDLRQRAPSKAAV